MKKLITISVLLALVIGFAIFEVVVTSTYFNSLASELYEASETAKNSEEDEVNTELTEKLGSMIDGWHERENLFYLLLNNNVLNNLFDRLLQAKAYADGGQNVDASTCIDGAAFYAESIALDSFPIPINFL